MRIRQVKPAYWADALLQKELTPAEREFYLGLWMLADDAGWLRWDPVEVAGELYRYEPSRRREANVRRYALRLEALGRLQIDVCGHGFIPTMPRHQRFAAETKKVYTVRNEHRERCEGGDPQMPAGDRGLPAIPERNGTERDGERDGGDRPESPDLESVRRLAADPATHSEARRVARRILAGRGSKESEGQDDQSKGVRV